MIENGWRQSAVQFYLFQIAFPSGVNGTDTMTENVQKKIGRRKSVNGQMPMVRKMMRKFPADAFFFLDQ